MNTPLLNAVIIDDEPLARNVIRKFLSAMPEIRVIAECGNGLEAINTIHELLPDLIFLDIEMPEMDGMSLLNELEHYPLVIFTTAYNQYAIRAFEWSAVDYLLKPFTPERFASAVQKALSRNGPDLSRQLAHLQQSLGELLRADQKFVTRILIKMKNGYSFLPVKDITWFEASSDYVKIHTADKLHLKNTSLNELEKMLNPRHFVRIHRSTIVNIHFIEEMHPYFNGEYIIRLQSGQTVKLSRSYKDKLKQLFGENP